MSLQFATTPRRQHDVIIEERDKVRGNPAQSEVPLAGEATQRARDAEIEDVAPGECESVVVTNGALGFDAAARIHDDHPLGHRRLHHE